MILVSNAPIPADGVEQVLEKTGVRRDAWDAIVSSGDIALRHIADKGYRRMHWVGPSERDYALYVRLPAPQVPLAEAEAIVCTGLQNDRNETVEDYRGLIEEGVALKRAVRVRQSRSGGRRRARCASTCAGAIAAEYERLGGEVFWAGKPHPVGLRHGAGARGASCAAGEPDLTRILAHRRCRAHRPRLRAGARRRRSVHRRRHPQR